MQDDDFDAEVGVPDDDELIGDPGEGDLGDLSGAGEIEAEVIEVEPITRSMGAARPRSSGGARKAAPRKAVRKAAKKKPARKAATKKSVKKAAKKPAKKTSARKSAKKGGKKKGARKARRAGSKK